MGKGTMNNGVRAIRIFMAPHPGYGEGDERRQQRLQGLVLLRRRGRGDAPSGAGVVRAAVPPALPDLPDAAPRRPGRLPPHRRRLPVRGHPGDGVQGKYVQYVVDVG